LLSYQKVIINRFFTEKFTLFNSKRIGYRRYSKYEAYDAEFISNEITTGVKRYFGDLKDFLRFVNDLLFTPISEMFNPIDLDVNIQNDDNLSHEDSFDSDTYSQRSDTSSNPIEIPLVATHEHLTNSASSSYESCSSIQPGNTLKHHHSTILETLMNGSKNSGLPNLKWSDVTKLIVSMGGSIRNVGGSIKMIFIPGLKNKPTRFDEPHPSDRLGLTKAITLRKMFRNWGVVCL